MFPFESAQVTEPVKSEFHDNLLAHVYTQEITYAVMTSQSRPESSDAKSMRASNSGQNSGNGDISIDAFGAIKHLDLPRGYKLESSAQGQIGGGKERIYRNTQDGDSTVATSILNPPVIAPDGQTKLQDLLAGGTGPLSDAQRAEASSFLAKFADNQYKPGNSASGYGDAWKAPGYYVRTMEVREVDGKRMLMVDGAHTPPPWKPADGLDKAESRFTAAFMLDGNNVQTVYLEAKPQNYSLQENKFVQSVRKATF